MPKLGRRSRLHDFRDADGEIISYAVLVAATGLTQGAIQNRLRLYDDPPTDLQAFLKTALEFRTKREFEAAVTGAEYTAEVEEAKGTQTAKATLEELEIDIKREKLREITFKNERTEGKYVLLDDVQLALDNFLIALKTNLEALPETVAQSVMTCREEHEAIEIILEALRHLTRDFADDPIRVGEETEASANLR